MNDNDIYIPGGVDQDAPPDKLASGPEGAVTIGYAHSHEVSYSWHHSLLEMVGFDLANEMRIWRGGYVAMRCGTGELVEARNKIVLEFFKQDAAEWLLMLDTDMGFAPDTLERLIAAADPVERPIVGALCFSWRETGSDGAGGFRTMASPTVFDWTHEPKPDGGERHGFAVRWDYPANTLTAVDGTGAACLLVHRSVFVRIRNMETPTPDGGKAPAGPVWFNRVPNLTTGQLISEDLSFCVRARAAGFPIFVHTGVATTHHKDVWVDEETYWQQRALHPPVKQAQKPGIVPPDPPTFRLEDVPGKPGVVRPVLNGPLIDPETLAASLDEEAVNHGW